MKEENWSQDKFWTEIGTISYDKVPYSGIIPWDEVLYNVRNHYFVPEGAEIFGFSLNSTEGNIMNLEFHYRYNGEDYTISEIRIKRFEIEFMHDHKDDVESRIKDIKSMEIGSIIGTPTSSRIVKK